MNNKYYNTSYIIKQNIKKYYSTHKYMFLFLLILFLVALITGIFTGIKGSADISINNINEFDGVLNANGFSIIIRSEGYVTDFVTNEPTNILITKLTFWNNLLLHFHLQH